MRDVLILELRNAIADKESHTACANHDVARYGEWQCNWAEAMSEAQAEIQRLLDEIKLLDKTS